MKLRRTNSHTVKVYDDILTPSVCDSLIALFTERSEGHDKIVNSGKPNFTQWNVNTHAAEMVPYLIDRVKVCVEMYQTNLLGLAKYMPPVKTMEQFRLKKYEPGGEDRFDEHIDVANYDSARRYLAFLFYLNNVDIGGETTFSFHDIIIKPKIGSVVVFPPTWEYPHSGKPPVSGNKYIMSTYLHYG